MARGKFIVIEGADGTGKETQTFELNQRLTARGVLVGIYDFPQYKYSFFGKLAGRFLNGEFGKLRDISPYLASLPYAGDRWQAKPYVLQNLEEGCTVLSSRYFLSNVAHQAAKLPARERREFISFLEELEYGVYGIPREDLNLVLYVSPEISQKLIEQKQQRAYLEGKIKDIHEEDILYQMEVARIYQELPIMYPNVVGINCMKEGSLMGVEEIHELVWNQVGLRFPELASEGRIRRERQR